MKLTHQTGIGTLVQFIFLSFLTLAGQFVSVAASCVKDGSKCIGDLLTSVIFYLLVAIVFGSIWLLGVAAQTRRSKRLAQLLICTEGLVALVALFSVKLSLHSQSIIGVAVSLSIFLVAAWIITLAFRLTRAAGGRVASGGQRRRRRTTS